MNNRTPITPANVHEGDIVVRPDGYALRVVRVEGNGATLPPGPDGGPNRRTAPFVVVAEGDNVYAPAIECQFGSLFLATEADRIAYDSRQIETQQWLSSGFKRGDKMLRALTKGQHDADEHI